MFLCSYEAICHSHVCICSTFFTSTSAHVAHVENGNAVCKLLPMRKPQKTLALCLVGGFGKGNGKGKRNAILFLFGYNRKHIGKEREREMN